uniref:Serpin domain-containing protein n=1 Tax=Panagrolaimus sp. PS1159 TaxID=55785 RepID=A0AC35GR80_9BILA
MFIILPYEKFGLSKMLKSFNVNELLDLMFARNSIEGNVVIPKFNAESSFELSQILRHLKINDAFDASNADFSGVTADAKIHISRILQKVSVKVSEEGTKAAAATVLEDIYISNDDGTFQFIADHPFLYILADKNKNIYFVGTFYN